MSAIEQEIIEKISKLDDAGKQRVLAFVEQELVTPKLTLGEWLAQATAIREELHTKYGSNHFDVQSTLDEIREESSLAAFVVVDSSIVLATILPELHSEKAKSLIEMWRKQNIQLAAPSLFRYEVIAVIRKNVYQQKLTPQEAVKELSNLIAFPIQFYLDEALLKRGYELATQYNRPTAYDAQYLAVAERIGCEFWTADERLYNAVARDLNWVKWLGHVVL